MNRHPSFTALGVCLLGSTSALGQTLPDPNIDCSDLENPVFIEAGDTQVRMLGDLGRYLRDLEAPITLVYLPRSTCTLIENVFLGNPTLEVMRYVPSRAEVPEWDGVPFQCTVPEAGYPIDLGIAATFSSSCSESVLDQKPDEVAILRGPVQGYGFVTPEGVASSVKGITREEAYFVFAGLGAEAGAVPWTAEPNPEGGTPSLWIRRATTSTLLTLAANVAPDLLPAANWVGFRMDGQDDRSSVVIAGVKAASGTALEEATLGLLGLDLYDRSRADLDVLAYQAEGQHYGYYPDSTPSAHDKRNVRDGHYVPWAYTEYLVPVDDAGEPVNDQTARVVDMILGQDPVHLVSASDVEPEFDIDAMQVVAAAGLVPACAMGVSREFDGGELSLFDPEAPCGCFYETVQDPSLLTDPPPAWTDQCEECDASDDCEGSHVCRRGYCEVH